MNRTVPPKRYPQRRGVGEWKEYSIKQLIEDKKFYIGDGYRAKNSELASSGIPFARAGNIDNGFNFEKVDLFPSECLHKVGEKTSKPDDIVFTSKGTVGRFAFVMPETQRFVYSPQLCFWRCSDKALIDSRWLYYWMYSREFREQVNSVKDQTDMAEYVNLNDQRNMFITLPPLPEQRAIASVLSSLDDKIDLLRRQNATLEAMAKTLFRQWFIEEADEGWEEKPLSSIATFLNGLACQKYPPENDVDKLPVLKIRELSGGISADSDWATSNVDEEYIVESGDVIFAWSASLMIKIWDGPKCVLNQHLFKVSSDSFPKWYYYLWCRHHLAEFISISASHATTMGHIKRGDLDAAMVLDPGTSELKRMTKIMGPALDKSISNAKQVKQLESLRDTLLPKLMSGEVRVNMGAHNDRSIS
jgi:type I restriction enzyme, S subunit